MALSQAQNFDYYSKHKLRKMLTQRQLADQISYYLSASISSSRRLAQRAQLCQLALVMITTILTLIIVDSKLAGTELRSL